MFKAIIFKEWLKIRWAFVGMQILFVVMLIYITLSLDYSMRLSGATNYWYAVIMRGILFYSGLFVYLPAIAGLTLAITQFYPEMNENRLKLTFHLPMNENTILLIMIATGTVALLLIYLVAYLFLSVITLSYFPVEVLNSVLITSAPWFVAGLVCYWAVTMILVEPIWFIRRILLILLSYGFINSLLYVKGYNLYSPSIHIFIIISLFFSLAILFSAYRFRKGVM